MLRRFGSHNLRDAYSLKKHQKNENQSMITKEEFLTHFFGTLNKENLDYFVFGEYACLPQDTGGSDIDIFVSIHDTPAILSILRTMIDANDIQLASYYYSSNPNWFVRLITSTWGVQIDFFGGAHVWKTACYYRPDFLRSSVIMYHGIKVLDIRVGYYLDFFKEVIHLGKVKEKYMNGFITEYQRNSQRKAEIEIMFGKETADAIATHIADGTLADGIPQLQRMMQQAISHGTVGKRSRLFFSKCARLFRRPGYVIAVLGTDGSGKSTIINAITPWLDECFHHGVVYNHLRPNALPDLGVVLGKKEAPKKGEEPKVNENPHGLNPSGFVGSLVRWGYYMIDYTFGYMKTVLPQVLTKSKVFIFDRYYYDYYIDQRRSRTSLPHWILRFGECFVPSPDLTLCLGGDPKKIYERKPETSLQEVERQTIVLRSFCKKRKRTVWIDTTLKPEKSIQMAKETIVKMLTPRFKNVKL